MGRVEGLRDLRDNGHRAGRAECAVTVENHFEVSPLDEAHGDIEAAALLAYVVDRNHIRVLDPRSDLRLPFEAMSELAVARKVRQDHLKRHRSRWAKLRRAIHD